MARVLKKKDEQKITEEEIDKIDDEFQMPDSGGLDTLRDILFGPQAQATKDRLDLLERRILEVKKELSKNTDEEVRNLQDSSKEQLKAARQELESQLDKQSSEQSTQLRALQEEQRAALDKLSDNFEENIRSTQNKVSEKIDDLNNSLSEQMLEMQAEFRKRDDDLREQILTLSAWLDEQKPSREDLSTMLISMGKELQKTKKSKIADSGNEESK